MSIEEELHEHAEHAKEPFDKRVAATMAIIAAALAVVSVLGHICTTEEIVLQQRAADQWAFAQAKDIRRYASELAVDQFRATHLPQELIDKYSRNLERYGHDTEENRKAAREFETERDLRHGQALRLHFGEVFLEISIVFASLAILTKRPLMWWCSIAGAVIGVVAGATAAAVR